MKPPLSVLYSEHLKLLLANAEGGLSLHLLYFFCFRQRNALSYVQNILLIKMCVHTELEVATYVNTCNCALLFFPILFQKQLSIQAITVTGIISALSMAKSLVAPSCIYT